MRITDRCTAHEFTSLTFDYGGWSKKLVGVLKKSKHKYNFVELWLSPQTQKKLFDVSCSQIPTSKSPAFLSADVRINAVQRGTSFNYSKNPSFVNFLLGSSVPPRSCVAKSASRRIPVPTTEESTVFSTTYIFH